MKKFTTLFMFMQVFAFVSGAFSQPLPNCQLTTVQAAVDAAPDDSVVELPECVESWNNALVVNKGIILKGQTTTSNTGTANASADDRTVIIDNSQPGVIDADLEPDEAFRVTGITFRGGTGTAPDGTVAIRSSGAMPNENIRVDNCHFDNTKTAVYIGGWIYGVTDHNFMEVPNAFYLYVQHGAWGGYSAGHGSWADYPFYGTDRFFFFETNTVIGEGRNMDAHTGGRFVVRNNYIRDAFVVNHGTEGGVLRSARNYQVYNNTFHRSGSNTPGQTRGGGAIWHDNEFTGTMVNFVTQLAIYREVDRAGNWGFAQGYNPWDKNDPDRYVLTTATANSSCSGTSCTVNVTGPLQPGQWVGYSVSNPISKQGSLITANDANSITYRTSAFTDLSFVSGNDVEIWRVQQALDQSGTGKGDLLGGNPVINTVTGVVSFPNWQEERCFSWNNKNGSTPLHITRRGNDTAVEGRDYENLGIGLPANTIPSAVQSYYSASRNGVDYTQEFCYPHPLVTGSPCPTVALPVFRAAGTKSFGTTGAVTVAPPAGVATGDLEILISGTDVAQTLSITGSGGSAWTAVSGTPVAAIGGTKLYVWYRIRQAGDGDPQVTPSGNFSISTRLAYQAGTFDTTTPVDSEAIGKENTVDTSFSFTPGTTTSVNSCLVLVISTSGADNNTGQVPVCTNANLTNLNSRANDNTNSGGGGGYGVTEGALAIAGDVGTFACTYVLASGKAYLSFAIRPSP